MRMQIHLPNEQIAYFEPGYEDIAINRAHPSMLMQRFTPNQSDPDARCLYGYVSWQKIRMEKADSPGPNGR